MPQKYQFHEDYWSPEYPWFIVDNGLILYAFKTEAAAQDWLRSQYINYMLVTHLDELRTMYLEPEDSRCWESCRKECVELLWLNGMKPQ